MSSKFLQSKNLKFRFNFVKLEKNILLYKIIFLDMNELLNSIFYIYLSYSKYTKNIKYSNIRNICLYTGRTRGIFKKYKMSRIFLKILIENGFINGIQKAS